MTFHRRQFLQMAVGTAALPTISRFAWAQSYPTRPVRLVVGYPAGGTTDILARLMASQFYLGAHKHSDGTMAIEDDSPAGSAIRTRIGEALVHDIGRMFRATGLQLGYRYDDSPICVPDGTPPNPDDPTDYIPSTRPGSRAPHAWLGDGRSTLDLFGRGFVLLRLGSKAPDVSAIKSAATARRVPLEIATVTEPNVMELYQSRLVLVRPDGHVVWRGDDPPPIAEALIDKVRGAEA